MDLPLVMGAIAYISFQYWKLWAYFSAEEGAYKNRVPGLLLFCAFAVVLLLLQGHWLNSLAALCMYYLMYELGLYAGKRRWRRKSGLIR